MTGTLESIDVDATEVLDDASKRSQAKEKRDDKKLQQQVALEMKRRQEKAAWARARGEVHNFTNESRNKCSDLVSYIALRCFCRYRAFSFSLKKQSVPEDLEPPKKLVRESWMTSPGERPKNKMPTQQTQFSRHG